MAFDRLAHESGPATRGLRQRNRELLDALLDDAKGYRDALHRANPTDPWITVLLCICLAQQRVLVDARIGGDGKGESKAL